jgi:hypothetical protein
MNISSKLQQQLLLNKKLQRLLESSTQEISNLKVSTDSAVKTASSALQAADDSIKPTALTSGLAGKADLVHTHNASDITSGLAAVATSGNYSSLNGYPNINRVSNFAATDVALANANTYYNCATVSLTAGTWLLMGTSTLGRTTTTAGNYNLRISDGLNHHASTQHYHASVANNFASLSCNAIVTVATTTTIHLQAAGTLTNDVAKATTPNNASGANATGLIGIRIA